MMFNHKMMLGILIVQSLMLVILAVGHVEARSVRDEDERAIKRHFEENVKFVYKRQADDEPSHKFRKGHKLPTASPSTTTTTTTTEPSTSAKKIKSKKGHHSSGKKRPTADSDASISTTMKPDDGKNTTPSSSTSTTTGEPNTHTSSTTMKPGDHKSTTPPGSASTTTGGPNAHFSTTTTTMRPGDHKSTTIASKHHSTSTTSMKPAAEATTPSHSESTTAKPSSTSTLPPLRPTPISIVIPLRMEEEEALDHALAGLNSWKRVLEKSGRSFNDAKAAEFLRGVEPMYRTPIGRALAVKDF